MGFWARLFGVNGGSRSSFKKVDWFEIEQRLRSLKTLLNSSAQADAKQVLIQADSLVDSVMKQAGVPGTSFGERLKNLKNDLPRSAYSQLWQAHLKRNELVHETGSFVADWEKQRHFKAFEEAIYTMRGLR